MKTGHEELEITRIRNIGILAHIDAGSFGNVSFVEVTYKNF